MATVGSGSSSWRLRLLAASTLALGLVGAPDQAAAGSGANTTTTASTVEPDRARRPGLASPRARRAKGQASASKPKAKSKTKAEKKAPATAAECSGGSPVFTHVVARGEHLGGIAGRYGVRRSDLITLNPALRDNPNLIRVGQTLRVCPEITPRTRVELHHTVEAGESLGSIAHGHGMTVRELIGAQPEPLRGRLTKNPNHVAVGVVLRLLVDKDELTKFRPREAAPTRGGVATRVRSRRGLLIKRPTLAYGTPKTVHALERALASYRRRAPGGPKIRLGDISRRGGGELRGHLSHRKGVDVDLGLVLKGKHADIPRFIRPSRGTFDAARTWTLLRSLLDTDQVRVIFLDYGLQKKLYKYARGKGVREDELDEIFQYPRGRGRAHGIVRHWDGHRGHLHVRFRG